jgi:hypothetical protein
MSLTFRILLILAAVWAFRFVIIEIRKSKLQITDSLSWFFITLVFILLALFPQIAEHAAELLHIQSPVNLVYLVVIAILIFRIFLLTVRVSQLDNKVKELTQRLAIDETDEVDEKNERV